MFIELEEPQELERKEKRKGERKKKKGKCLVIVSASYVLGLWTELARWNKMRNECLQGGNLAAKKLKPPKKQIDEMRQEFVDQIELLKRRKRNPATRDKAEQEKMKSLQVPLQPSSFEMALTILKSNKMSKMKK